MENTDNSVWTYNNDPKYLAKNAGVPDMRLAKHLTHDNAVSLVVQLSMRWPDEAFFVRNARDVVTHSITPLTGNVPRETSQRPARRRLGTREG